MRDLWPQCWHQTAAQRSLGSAPFLQERQPLSALWGRWMDGNSVPTQSLSKPFSRSKRVFLGLLESPSFALNTGLAARGGSPAPGKLGWSPVRSRCSHHHSQSFILPHPGHSKSSSKPSNSSPPSFTFHSTRSVSDLPFLGYLSLLSI